MDIKRIEPLLMDYALGAATPEVAALIEAYQETNDEVRAHLEQWRVVAECARQALEEGEPVGLPVFPRQRLQDARRMAQWRRAAVLSAALAACLMLGCFVGIRWQERSEPAATTTNLPVAAVENLWSQARLRSIAEQDAANMAARSLPPLRTSANLLQQIGG